MWVNILESPDLADAPRHSPSSIQIASDTSAAPPSSYAQISGASSILGFAFWIGFATSCI